MNQLCLVLFLFIEFTVGQNTCLYNGKKYGNGEVTSFDDCKTCYCGVFGIYCFKKPCRGQVTCKMNKNINTNIPETSGITTKSEDECVSKCLADSKCRISKYEVSDRLCELASEEVLNKTYFEFGVHVFIKECTEFPARLVTTATSSSTPETTTKIPSTKIEWYTTSTAQPEIKTTSTVTMKQPMTTTTVNISSPPESRLQIYGSSEIIQELIQPLTIKCLYKTIIQGERDTSALQSLYLLHETNGVIAYIKKQQPVIATIQGDNFKNVEGEIFDNESKDSYLQVTWNDLKHSESGKYFCEAYVNQSDGRFDKMNEMLTIIVQSPTFDDLVKVIQKLQRQAEVDKETVRENQHKIKTIQEDLDTKQQDIISLKEDMNTTKQDIMSIKEDLDTKSQNILSIRENFDTNKHNMIIFQDNLTMTVANFSAALKEVENSVNKLLQYYLVPHRSCRNVTSNETRVIVTLSSGLKAMCDTKTDGGGWMIIQRRINGKVDFYRGWKEYRDGFGDYNIGEFYLGNENIFKLTSTGQYDLRIDLEYNNKSYFAQYEDFKVLNETDNFQLQIGKYSGNAGDSLRRQNNTFFSTLDRENDIDNIDNCAQRYLGAWWYKDCHDSNLNGQWGNKSFGKGMNWYGLTQWSDSVTFSEMKIRERE
ncbi:BgiBFREP17.3 [Biomphalaria glabrata]|nr:BgiBFREP17.3 [Biomphalaria glabrata]